MGDAAVTERPPRRAESCWEEEDIIKPPQKLLDQGPGLGHLVLLLLRISVVIQSSRGQLVKISLMFVKLGPEPESKMCPGPEEERINNRLGMVRKIIKTKIHNLVCPIIPKCLFGRSLRYLTNN